MQTIEIKNGIQLDFEDLLKGIQRLDNQSLSKFAYEVNQLVSKRTNNIPNKRESELLKEINSIIPASIKHRQKQLYLALEEGIITQKEHKELVLLNDKLEEKAAERVLLLGELATLRGVSIQELVANL